MKPHEIISELQLETKLKINLKKQDSTPPPSEFVGAPIINELPFAVECKVKSYDAENWKLIGEIVNVSLDESILGENGKVSFEKFHPIAFDWMNKIYLDIGKKVGNAYRDGLELKWTKKEHPNDKYISYRKIKNN